MTLQRPFLLGDKTSRHDPDGKFLRFHQRAYVNCILLWCVADGFEKVFGPRMKPCVVSKRVLSCLFILGTPVPGAQMRWANFVIQVFDVIGEICIIIRSRYLLTPTLVMLVVALVRSSPNTDQGFAVTSGVKDWLDLVPVILRILVPDNLFAMRVLRCFEQVKETVLFADDPNQPPREFLTSHLTMATRILAQAPPTLTDVGEGLVGEERIPMFEVHFPGIQIVCANEGDTIGSFIESCVNAER